MAITVEQHKLAYMALPKAACTSVKRLLAQVDETVSQPDTSDIMAWHGIYPTRRFRPHRWQAYEDHFRFCVLRDPIKRLMSCYSDIVAGRNELANSPRLRKSARYVVNPDPDYFFLNLEGYKARSSLIKHHALSAQVFLGPKLHAHYDRVYRTSELEELGHDLSRRTGRILRVPHSNATKATLQIDDLLDETIDALRPFLDQEYSYLDGWMKNPLGPRWVASCAVPS